MSKAGAFDLASGLGGKIDKNEVLSAVDKYFPLSRISHFLYLEFSLKCMVIWSFFHCVSLSGLSLVLLIS